MSKISAERWEFSHINDAHRPPIKMWWPNPTKTLYFGSRTQVSRVEKRIRLHGMTSACCGRYTNRGIECSKLFSRSRRRWIWADVCQFIRYLPVHSWLVRRRNFFTPCPQLHKYLFLERTQKIFVRILVGTRAWHQTSTEECTSHARKLGSIPRQRALLLEIFLYSKLAVQRDLVNMRPAWILPVWELNPVFARTSRLFCMKLWIPGHRGHIRTAGR